MALSAYFKKSAAISFALVGGMALAATVTIHAIQSARMDMARENFVSRQHQQADTYRARIEDAFNAMQGDLRSIAMLPTIRGIDRHASNLGQVDKDAVNEIYQHLNAAIQLSEIYVVPASFNPKATDPETGKPEAPAIMFDSGITGDSGADSSSDAGKAPQVEDYEYALLYQQIQEMKVRYPSRDTISGLEFPMISGHELITCDNSEFDKSGNDTDRKGMVLSVPYFDPAGQFAGLITAVIRTNVLRNLLPASDAALVNPTYGYTILAKSPGQAGLSSAAAQSAVPDKSLYYSEAIAVKTADQAAPWLIWSGKPNEAFASSEEAMAVKKSGIILYGAVATISILVLAAITFLRRKYYEPMLLITQRIVALSNGAIDLELPFTKRKDQIGKLAHAVQVLTANETRSRKARQAQEGEREAAERSRREAAALAIQSERELVATALGTSLTKLAHRDLTNRVGEGLPEAYQGLRDDYNNAVAAFERVISELNGSVLTLNDDTSEMSIATDDLSRRIASQAMSLEETASAIADITKRIRETALNTRKASDGVAAAKQDAENSSAVVKQASEAMTKIAESSEQITRIIGVIDEIAFQTNLLALNAGVEAARAGEAGKGFAVVAQEVRALAQRSADSAKQIKSLIATSHEQVKQGVSLVTETGSSLERIAAGVHEINAVVSEITTEANAQAQTLDHVNDAVSRLNIATQQNAVEVQQTAAATTRVSSLAKTLASISSAFHVTALSEANQRPGLRKIA